VNAFCSSCGQPVPLGASFCGGCGTPIGNAAAPVRKKTHNLAILSVLIAVSGLVAYTLLRVHRETETAKVETMLPDRQELLFTKRCQDVLSAEGIDVQCRADADRRLLIITGPKLTRASALKFMTTQRRAAENAGFDTISFWNGKKLPDHVYTEDFLVNPEKLAKEEGDQLGRYAFAKKCEDAFLDIGYDLKCVDDEANRALLIVGKPVNRVFVHQIVQTFKQDDLKRLGFRSLKFWNGETFSSYSEVYDVTR
jgi:hypothetical protein